MKALTSAPSLLGIFAKPLRVCEVVGAVGGSNLFGVRGSIGAGPFSHGLRVRGVVRPRRFPSAKPTGPLPFRIYVRICLVIRMTGRACGLAEIRVRPVCEAVARIVPWGAEAQMFEPDARRVVADRQGGVQDKHVWGRHLSGGERPRHPMGKLPAATPPKSTVSLQLLVTSPDPALAARSESRGLVDPTPEPCNRLRGGSGNIMNVHRLTSVGPWPGGASTLARLPSSTLQIIADGGRR